MSEAFVVDASTAFAWAHADQASAYTAAILESLENGASAHAPSLWRLELANILLVANRRKKMTVLECEAALAFFENLPIAIDLETSSMAFGKTSDLAREHSLSAYDACYLELAVRKKLPLATRDESLIKAAKRSGITVHKA